MIDSVVLAPGVTLRFCGDRRFKKGGISVQLLRPMCREEAAKNALIPAVLLRGSRSCPDLQEITFRLDELYGASISCLVRRVGEIQTVGFYMSFMEDRFAMKGDRVLEPAAEFLREMLLEPVTENGIFRRDYVESEKKNLISVIESELNNKQTYATAKMLRQMCAGDSFAVPRLGRAEEVAKVTAEDLYAHYQTVLTTSPAEIFYVGSAPAEQVAKLLKPLAQALAARVQPLPPQTGLTVAPRSGEQTEAMDINQSKLAMGFTTPITNRDPEFAAMLVANTIYGGDATSKLFRNVREKQSLCYYASSSYAGSKGIVTVSCGMDADRYEQVKEEILHQLRLCAAGEITDQELNSAKAAIISSLRSVPDSPGSLEGYYAVAAVSGFELSLEDYIAAVERVTAADAARAAATVQLQSIYFLKGEAR